MFAKTCSSCGEMKDLSEFSRKRRNGDPTKRSTWESRCRLCINDERRGRNQIRRDHKSLRVGPTSHKAVKWWADQEGIPLAQATELLLAIGLSVMLAEGKVEDDGR